MTNAAKYEDILVLPKPDPQVGKSHNIFFTKLSELIKLIRNQKENEQIQSHDIGKYITQETDVGSLIKGLESFKSLNGNYFKPESFNLYKMFMFMTGKNMLIGILLSLTMNCLSALGIVILDEITNFLKDFDKSGEQKAEISFMLLAIVVNYFIKSILHSQYQWQGNKWHAKCKTTIQYLVYQKALRMKIYTNSPNSSSNDKQQEGGTKEQKSQENKPDEEESQKYPDINNILTVDVETTLRLYTAFIETLSSVVTITVIILLIYYKIGSAIVNGLYILLGAFILNMIVGFLVGVAMEYMYEIKDERSVLSKDVIEGIKSIKYLSWESIFMKKIESVRQREYHGIVFLKIFDAILTMFWQSLKVVLLYTFLNSYIDQGNELQNSNIFTIIALFGNLTYPLGILPHTIEQMAQSRVSYKRIATFLNQPEIQTEKVEVNAEEVIHNIAIHLSSTVFSWPSRDNNTNPEEISQQKQTNPKKKLNKIDIEEERLGMKMSSSSKQTQLFELKINNFVVKKGSLSYVIGKIGSGKTALLLSVLNEMDSKQLEKKIISQKLTNPNHIILTENNEINLPADTEEHQGEIKDEAKFIINGDIGYVGQNHWLQSQTVRENILFGLKYDTDWYHRCVQACDLDTDFQQFSGGDLKIISADGGNLSGGQRQRVSLCRAIYQNKDIYLFDDIFSSLDVHVAHKIHQNILNLLVHQLNKTLLLVTSHYSFLSSTIENARIIYINDGSLVEDPHIIQDYIQQSAQKEEHNSAIPQNIQTKSNEIKSDKVCQQGQSDSLKENDKEINLNNQQLNHKNFVNKQEEEQQEEDENEELREKGEIKLQTWKAYLKSIGWLVIIPFLFFEMLPSAGSIFTDFWLRDEVSKESDKQFSFHFLNSHFGSFQSTFLFLTLLSVGFSIVGGLLYFTACLLSSYRIFKKLNNSIMYSKMKFYDKNPIGRIMKRLSDDINIIDDILPMNVQIFLDEFSYTIGYPVGILVQNPWLIAFVLMALGIAYFIQKQYRESNREMRRLTSVDSGRLLTHISESCRGLVLIRSFSRELYMTSNYLEKLSKSINSFLLSESLQIWMDVRLLMICCAVQAFVAITAFIVIVAEISLDYNIIALSLTYSILFTNTFADCLLFFCQSEQNFISVERVRQYFDNPQEDLSQLNWNKKENTIIEPQNALTSEEIEGNNSIVFKSVSISYDDQVEKDVQGIQDNQFDAKPIHYALKNISFSIKRGEKVAFCGRTGSGKTSILNILFGMYPIQKGEIYVNNKNIHQYALKDLRSQMSIIPQFGFLYHATLRDNLDPENLIEKSKISEIINKTNLKIGKGTKSKGKIEDKNGMNLDKQLIQNHSKKVNSEKMQEYDEEIQQKEDQGNNDDLDFEIEDGGKNLSNGQKQIINFLRIVLRETEIICLDEATSNMDPTTDALLHQKLFEFAAGKTLIVITHRLENIDLFDRVVVLEQGEIVESGHVTDLMKIQGGFFNRLYHKQL